MCCVCSVSKAHCVCLLFCNLSGTTFIQLFNNLVPLAICSVSQMPQVNALALLSFVVLIVLCWSCHVNAVYFGCTTQLLLLFLSCKKGLCCCHCQAGVAYWCHCCHCCCFSSVPNQAVVFVPKVDTSTVFYLNLYFVLFVCGTNCLCTRTSLLWDLS